MTWSSKPKPALFWPEFSLESRIVAETADSAPTECDKERDGTSYWGKLKFEMSDAGRTYTGKWGYCEAEPDVAFQAKWDGK